MRLREGLGSVQSNASMKAIGRGRSIRFMSWLKLKLVVSGESGEKGRASYRLMITPVSVLTKNDIGALRHVRRHE